MKMDANKPPSAKLPPLISSAAPGNGTRNKTSIATKTNGILIKINGLALPAIDGFLSINLPTNKLPIMITMAEIIGRSVSNSGAQVPKPKTLSQYWISQMLTTPFPTKAKIGPNK